MSKRRFEFQSSSSYKFWEIDLSNSQFTVCYGRIGTKGQTKTKTCKDTNDAKSAVEKLIASKVKKGYVEIVGESKHSKKALTSVSKYASENQKYAAPELTITFWDGFISVWREKQDLWIIGVDKPSYEALPEGVTLIDLIEADGFVEKWHFETISEANETFAQIKAEKKL